MHPQDAVAIEHPEVVLAVEVHLLQDGERRFLRFLHRHLAGGSEIAKVVDGGDRGPSQGAQLGPAVLVHPIAHVEQHIGGHAHEHRRENRDDEQKLLADGEFVEHFDPRDYS
jgi:hypothetical protein